ncbi:helicase [Candidatus Syntrophocurvum alkaliphilum]|uniref:ATP-dependent RNA helicase CshA n=1 Tax=Candidatus Syntrophocurvum alkaliphilum TaxID=2293317 RepID=A0A6I6DF17_9FIRM|nr:DEAD/DEAH box helicase [Candidatus Syntrophocurvum alkaliphilum]QGU00666.1 helicase [Candidatus Syntrophocurvum alkaliphilum]
MTTFRDLNLASEIIEATTDMGFEEPTPIQTKTIPLALEGKDLIGRAQTGTGKTAAFGIPIVDKCDPTVNHIQAIVITPTRELAIQVAEELNKIGHNKGIKSLPIYGGQDIERQIRALKKGVQVVIGTPGRLMDHMRRRTIRLQQLKMVVLDEADEMLNMGFREDIEEILEQVPEQRQTLLFSATIPPHIKNLARKFMHNPETININPSEVTVRNITQQYIEIPESKKLDVLCRFLDIYNSEMTMIFSRTKKRVDEISEALTKRGYSAEGIHGDLTQGQRDHVMRKFKSGSVEILVATDVAGRGLDISGVTHVYNFDIPQDPESYVHRIGRTGRAGETGVSTTFVTPREIGHLRVIEELTKQKITRKPVPTVSEAFEGLQRMVVESLLVAVEKGDNQEYEALAKSLLEEHDSVTLLSTALKMLTKEPVDAPAVELSSAPPIKVREENKNRSKKRNYSDKKTNHHKKYNKKGRAKTR